jgi:hypothetical protein
MCYDVYRIFFSVDSLFGVVSDWRGNFLQLDCVWGSIICSWLVFFFLYVAAFMIDEITVDGFGGKKHR